MTQDPSPISGQMLSQSQIALVTVHIIVPPLIPLLLCTVRQNYGLHVDARAELVFNLRLRATGTQFGMKGEDRA